MSKATRRPGSSVKVVQRSPKAGLMAPRVREMVGELHKLCDAIEGGVPLEKAARVRTVPPDVPLPVVSSEGVRAVRESLGLNQAGFADFLGVGLSTLRRWELGEVVPSSVARRFLGEVGDDPDYWRKRLSR